MHFYLFECISEFDTFTRVIFGYGGLASLVSDFFNYLKISRIFICRIEGDNFSLLSDEELRNVYLPDYVLVETIEKAEIDKLNILISDIRFAILHQDTQSLRAMITSYFTPNWFQDSFSVKIGESPLFCKEGFILEFDYDQIPIKAGRLQESQILEYGLKNNQTVSVYDDFTIKAMVFICNRESLPEPSTSNLIESSQLIF